MGTKDVREKWWSSDQSGSFGAFTYWSGYWNDNLVNNMDKNGVDSGLARLTPITEMDGYLNRESPVYCIIDDGDGDDSREQAIFDAVFETMFDGGTVQKATTGLPKLRPLSPAKALIRKRPMNTRTVSSICV